MKKRIMAIVLMILLVTLTGCNTTQLSYWEKANQATGWEASEVKQSGNIQLTYGGEKIKANYTAEGYGEGTGLNAYLKLNLDLMVPASITGTDDVKGKVVMESYIKDGKVYINKGYFEDLYKLLGAKPPLALEKLDASYIGIKESNEQMLPILEKIGATKGKYDPKEIIAFNEKFATLIALDLPVTQEGETYKIVLDGKVIGNQFKNTLDKGVENIIPLNTLFEGLFTTLGATEQDFKTLQKEYAVEKKSIHEQIDQWMNLANPKIEMTTTFGKDQRQDKIILTSALPGVFDFKMSMNQEAKKVVAKEIKITGKTVELTEEQLSKLVVPSIVRIEEEKGILINVDDSEVPVKVINKNNQKYVPARTTLTELNIPLGYDKAKGYAYGVFGDKEVKVNELTKDGVAYVSLGTLQKAGVQVKVSGAPGYATILLSY